MKFLPLQNEDNKNLARLLQGLNYKMHVNQLDENLPNGTQLQCGQCDLLLGIWEY